MSELQSCDPDIYKNGRTVFVAHSIPAPQVEAWVRCVAALSGQPVDWHYVGGRACVKTTGDEALVQQSIGTLLPALGDLFRASWPDTQHGEDYPDGQFYPFE